MADLQNLSLATDGSILTITINRESKLNALNTATLAELKEVIQSVYDDKEISGVILTGAGEKAFAAGADIGEFSELNEMNARKFAEEGQEVFQLIENSHTPVIAVVNGFALGGGCELAMACHMRVASANARLGQPEVNLGILPGYGGTQRLTQLIGKGRAFEYLMTGDMMDANQAQSFGLVNYTEVDKEAAMAKANEILAKISAKAPIAIGLVVDCVNAVYNHDENGYQTEANAFARCCGTDDFKEGASAFMEKRTPEFKGE
ncbi:enoyl-CoA hydratase/isomerase family protein [Marinoscillum furvescens]|uniref:Enoyl-CoA hydratase n=1 Tax=Marinoscillum furvescens DSM 4134 TaxID=1122208 RepID=A0A3D9LL54_MARFU|nr:enoyl-CoA hydratase-related protein [Marinoscillum furvescens]REE05992.1 enoyl-CoA hydratase [Marinoscillum furvescens DSM 4134]